MCLPDNEETSAVSVVRFEGPFDGEGGESSMADSCTSEGLSTLRKSRTPGSTGQ